MAPDGNVLDELTFVTLSLPDTIDDEKLQPALDPKSFKWMRPADAQAAAKQAFVPRDDLLPAGFRVLNLPPETNAEAKGPKTRFIVSDGIAWVSVFVTAADERQPRRPAADAPSGYLYFRHAPGRLLHQRDRRSASRHGQENRRGGSS